MNTSTFRLLFCLCLTVVLAACGSSSEINYFYEPSPYVIPDTVYSNDNHKLDIGVKVLTPDRICWQNDIIGYGRDSDSVAHVRYVSVTASVKRPMNATNCVDGNDTLHNRLVIPFDSAGTYRIDFPGLDSRGNFKVIHYNYKVN